MRFDLKKALFILPNLFTLSSIFCGFFAVLTCLGEPTAESFYKAALLIVFAMFFDGIDGRVARATKTQSAFGVQIDSLADVVSFGVAPAVLLYRWSLHQLGDVGTGISFLFLACGAIRLARFNVLATAPSGAPKKPSKFILGLPIPGAAGIVVSIVVANFEVTGHFEAQPYLVAAVVIALSFFMVSTIKFRSFKDVRWGARSIFLVLAAVGSATAIAIAIHPAFALVWMLAGYITIGVLEAVLDISRRLAGKPSRLIETALADEERPEARPHKDA
ncbi:MAG: CDP-diacylglycerol--serine O-phosphatidyltransferase [Sandaracinaceae bacterium]|nr:CDP-diacylglycerol--serine O-phosphatidyltransferase [Sandaracinaceae bacterium]